MKKNKKYLIIGLICIAAAIFLPLTYSLAKYVKDVVLEYQMKSKGFYFSSPVLGKNKVINSWTGEAINFTLLNSLSNELVTEYDINYEVTCEVLGDEASIASCQLNDKKTSSDAGVLNSYQTCLNDKQDGINVSNYSKSECELGGYIWEVQIATQNIYFEIIPNGEQEINQVKVKIEVKSTSPYVKTLEGTFALYKTKDNYSELKTEYHDLTNMGKLELSNKQNEERCINLKWNPEELLIEEEISVYNSYLVDENNYIKEINFNIESNRSIELIFYKKTAEEITLENFDISDCTT